MGVLGRVGGVVVLVWGELWRGAEVALGVVGVVVELARGEVVVEVGRVGVGLVELMLRCGGRLLLGDGHGCSSCGAVVARVRVDYLAQVTRGGD